MFLLDAVAQRVLQLVERFHAKRLGKFVVDRDLFRRLDGLHLDVEFGFLAGEFGVQIILRERHFDELLVAGGDADQLIFEARNEGAGSDRHGDVLGGAAFERVAADLSDEGDRHAIVLRGLGVFTLVGERPVRIGDALERVADFAVGDLGGELGQFDRAKIRQLDRRQDFHRNRIGEIGFAGDQFLDLGLFRRQRDLRLHRETEFVVGDDLRVALAHDGLDRFGHHRAAIDALEVIDRHLAGTEAVDADAALDLAQALIDLGVEFIGGNDDFVLAPQSRGSRLGDLHNSFVPYRLTFKAFALSLSENRSHHTSVWRARAGAGGGTRTPTTFVTGT